MARQRRRLVDDAPFLIEQYSNRNPDLFESLWANPTPTLWWRCEVGHEFLETAKTRAGSTTWKKGDWRACPVCAHLVVTYRCGCMKRNPTPVDPDLAAAKDCSSCKWQRRTQMWDQAAASAADLVDRLPLDVVRPALRPQLRWQRLKVLTEAWLAEHGDGDDGRVERTFAQLAAQDESALLPSPAVVLQHAADGRRVRVGEMAVWAPGLLYVLTGQVATHPLHIPVENLRGLLASAETAWTTRLLTQTVMSWARLHGLAAAREVTIPFENVGGMWGRADLVVTDRDGRSLVIEIDQTNNLKSLAKLRFAVTCGAAAVWVRWGSGPFDTPQEITTIVV